MICLMNIFNFVVLSKRTIEKNANFQPLIEHLETRVQLSNDSSAMHFTRKESDLIDELDPIK